MLADMLTIQEEFGHLKGIKLVYMGDARYNMGNSLMIASAKMGMDFVACAPKKYFPNAELVLSVRVCKGERCNHHPHRGRKRRNKRCRCYLYRCLGIYG